jgi:hypothetical protein
MVRFEGRCYVCGKPVGKSFRLFSLSDSGDRAFLCHSGSCEEQLDSRDLHILKVKVVL